MSTNLLESETSNFCITPQQYGAKADYNPIWPV